MGQFGEYIKMALYNIRSNKGRSFLTMLGIIIGISSVITVLAIGGGLKEDVTSTGVETSVSVQINEEETKNKELITYDDILALKEQLAERVTGVLSSGHGVGSVETRKGKYELFITMTIPEAEADPSREKMISGNYFSEGDLEGARPVAIIDKASAMYLFGTWDVVGMDIEVESENVIQTVNIIGVRDYDDEEMAANAEMEKMFGMESTISIEMPYTTGESLGAAVNGFQSVSLYLAEGESANNVAKAAIQTLNSRHRNEGENLFTRQQELDLGNALGGILDAITAFVAFVAGISLLVGGIGVMNIMLVSVTERTREIGIRKSLGAKTSSIVAQFLCESAIISGLGGIIGILLGAGLSSLISVLNIGGLTAKLSPTAIILTTCFSCGVGIIFGIYPARKAAKMSPIDALRQI